MFELNPSPTFWAPVHLTVPGERDLATLELQFNHKTKVEIAHFLEKGKPQIGDDGKVAVRTPEEVFAQDLGAVMEAVSDWKMKDKDGTPVEFNEANMAILLANYPTAAAEILGSYIKALTVSKRKN